MMIPQWLIVVAVLAAVFLVFALMIIDIELLINFFHELILWIHNHLKRKRK